MSLGLFWEGGSTFLELPGFLVVFFWIYLGFLPYFFGFTRYLYHNSLDLLDTEAIFLWNTAIESPGVLRSNQVQTR
jgi:hypothetical protein